MKTLLFTLSKIFFLAIQIAPSIGQLAINMPIERSVFQRVNNKADIQIGGQTTVFIDKLQVKLEVLNGGSAISWTTVNTNIQPGYFRAQITNVVAGWYKMEIRALTNNVVVGVEEVEKVGVGEVFVIAGQSNAQGGRPPNPTFATNIFYGANDDRVNCINFSTNLHHTSYPLPYISKIAPETDVAPTGLASWCWAILGDSLAKNWNVPVIFFNAAIGATTISQWSSGANNLGWPYIFLNKSLLYYAKIYGIRSILWHQGESDIFNFDQHQSYTTNYQNNLINLIQKSREHFGENISWVISKVSRMEDWVSVNLPICQENTALIPGLNAFLGPYTDPIQPAGDLRDGRVHFRGTGLIELANAWYNSINVPSFINYSNPVSSVKDLQIVLDQFVFSNSLPPCQGINETIGSGNWLNPAIWSCGVLPTSLNDIIINTGHEVIIDNTTIYANKLTLKGLITFYNNGNLIVEDD